MKPPFVVFSDEVPEVEGRYPPPFDGEALACGREVGLAAGSERIGVSIDRIPPGRRTAFLHAHLREEEGVYVVRGTPILRYAMPDAGGYDAVQEVPLRPGAYVAFPAGTGVAHEFVNRGTDDVTLVVLGERHAGERVRYAHHPAFEAWRAENRPHRAWSDDAGKGWPYLIRTARLRVRPWDVSEAQALRHLALTNQERLARWMPRWASDIGDDDKHLADVRRFRAAFDREEDAILGVFLPDGTPIGGTGLHPRVGPGATEIGYWIDETYEGKGYVSEWVSALTRVAFEVLGLDRVEIRMDPDNARSRAIPSRLGFRHEATLPRRFPVGDGFADQMVWSMYRHDEALWCGWRYDAFDGLGRRLGGTKRADLGE